MSEPVRILHSKTIAIITRKKTVSKHKITAIVPLQYTVDRLAVWLNMRQILKRKSTASIVDIKLKPRNSHL